MSPSEQTQVAQSRLKKVALQVIARQAAGDQAIKLRSGLLGCGARELPSKISSDTLICHLGWWLVPPQRCQWFEISIHHRSSIGPVCPAATSSLGWVVLVKSWTRG